MKVNLKFKMKALFRHIKVREFCEAKLPVEENEKGVNEANIKSKHKLSSGSHGHVSSRQCSL